MPTFEERLLAEVLRQSVVDSSPQAAARVLDVRTNLQAADAPSDSQSKKGAQKPALRTWSTYDFSECVKPQMHVPLNEIQTLIGPLASNPQYIDLIEHGDPGFTMEEELKALYASNTMPRLTPIELRGFVGENSPFTQEEYNEFLTSKQNCCPHIQPPSGAPINYIPQVPQDVLALTRASTTPTGLFNPITDPIPPIRKFASIRYFNQNGFVAQRADSEQFTVQQQTLQTSTAEKPTAQIQKSTTGGPSLSPSASQPQPFPVILPPRSNLELARDARNFRSLEARFAIRVDSWLRVSLQKLIDSPISCPQWQHFQQQLIPIPSHTTETWASMTVGNKAAHEQAIIRLHEIAYDLFKAVRDTHATNKEWAGDYRWEDDPTRKFRAKMNSWNKMDAFWRLLNDKSGESVKALWIPVVQIHYGLSANSTGNLMLFA